MNAPSIVFERGPETRWDVLINVFTDGERSGTIAFKKATWDYIEKHGGIAVYVASKFEADR